jgi:hypothetical protein
MSHEKIICMICGEEIPANEPFIDIMFNEEVDDGEETHVLYSASILASHKECCPLTFKNKNKFRCSNA